jgi:exodeoxyribonuclease VII large subunit
MKNGDLFDFVLQMEQNRAKVVMDLKKEELKTEPRDFTVSDISELIKERLEGDFKGISISGEVSNLKLHTKSGNLYFSLKDESGVVDAVCWKGVASKLPFRLEDGLSVIVFGDISIQKKSSKYYITVKNVRLSGIGEILRVIKETRERLEKGGYFDASKKLPLPFFPLSIGVITSSSGAVIRDILHRLKDRFPTRVMIFDALMQGNGCVDSVIAGVRAFNALQTPPDVLIIARGGGSMEDLMPFNDERMCMAVFHSKIPIISAIGHETDYTILDYIASMRAPTPTAAAELATPVIADLRRSLQANFKHLEAGVDIFVNRTRLSLERSNYDLRICLERFLTYKSDVLQRFDMKIAIQKYSMKLSYLQENLLRMRESLIVCALRFGANRAVFLENVRAILENFYKNNQSKAKIIGEEGYLTNLAAVISHLEGNKSLKIEMMDGILEINVKNFSPCK